MRFISFYDYDYKKLFNNCLPKRLPVTEPPFPTKTAAKVQTKRDKNKSFPQAVDNFPAFSVQEQSFPSKSGAQRKIGSPPARNQSQETRRIAVHQLVTSHTEKRNQRDQEEMQPKAIEVRIRNKTGRDLFQQPQGNEMQGKNQETALAQGHIDPEHAPAQHAAHPGNQEDHAGAQAYLVQPKDLGSPAFMAINLPKGNQQENDARHGKKGFHILDEIPLLQGEPGSQGKEKERISVHAEHHVIAQEPRQGREKHAPDFQKLFKISCNPEKTEFSGTGFRILFAHRGLFRGWLAFFTSDSSAILL